jgi:hypothetical protein
MSLSSAGLPFSRLCAEVLRRASTGVTEVGSLLAKGVLKSGS